MGTISKTGLEQIVLCDGGTIADTPPLQPMAMGIRAGASLKRSAYKPIKDYLNRSWRNKINFRVEAETFQPTMLMLKNMTRWLNGNVDVQVQSNLQASTDTYGDLYIFDVDNSTNLGLDFELMFNADKRSIKATLEGALNYATAQALVDAADAGTTPYSFSGITGPGESQTYFRRPAFVALEAPKSTGIVLRDEIIERTYSIKTKSKKSVETNMSIVDYLTFEIMMKFRNASTAAQVAMMAKDNAPSLYIKELNAGAYYDAWDFAAGALTLDDEFEVTDEERSQTVKFVGDVFLFDISFSFGAAYGGTAGDGGTLGGTMVVAAP